MEDAAPPTGAPTTEVAPLTPVQCEQLEKEYDQLCQDWRWRDKYVLDKLTGSGILFTLLSLAIGQIQQEHSILRPFIFFGGFLVSIISSISIYKDVVYRNGTQKAIIRIAKQLGIKDAFLQLQFLQPTINDGIQFDKIDTLRKIQPDVSQSYIASFFGIRLGFLNKWMYNRPTFNWIFSFYLFFTVGMLALCVVSIYDIVHGGNLFAK